MRHNHEKILLAVRKKMPPEEILFSLADLFKSFGDSTRIRILYALSESELCVCAIGELLGMEQSAISHQLKKLRSAKLVTSRRVGRTVYYALADEHVKTVVDTGFAHVIEEG